MFTGIVEEIGVVEAIKPGFLSVSVKNILKGTKPGDSIAVNGICLTVTHIDKQSFSIDIMAETLRRTNLGQLKPGDKVNLERALEAGGRMGGHFVQGHIDSTGEILSINPEGESKLVQIKADGEITRYIVKKGFIAVDGVSLTIVDCNTVSFVISLVKYTLGNTILGLKKRGDIVNLEVDILAKYIENFTSGKKSNVTLNFLSEHGFLT
ncbi:MAG: riboflavin synthase [Chloroflexi bacterium]|nr:riboflavin synthase [Chloroflexota bacterium]